MRWIIRRKLQKKNPLPVGVKEFHEWSDRIIAAAGLLSRSEDQKYVLANVICHNCGPSVAFESDAYFISYLRKTAANQVAVAISKEIYEARKQENNQSAAGAPGAKDGAEVLPVK